MTLTLRKDTQKILGECAINAIVGFVASGQIVPGQKISDAWFGHFVERIRTQAEESGRLNDMEWGDDTDDSRTWLGIVDTASEALLAIAEGPEVWPSDYKNLVREWEKVVDLTPILPKADA